MFNTARRSYAKCPLIEQCARFTAHSTVYAGWMVHNSNGNWYCFVPAMGNTPKLKSILLPCASRQVDQSVLYVLPLLSSWLICDDLKTHDLRNGGSAGPGMNAWSTWTNLAQLVKTHRETTCIHDSQSFHKDIGTFGAYHSIKTSTSSLLYSSLSLRATHIEQPSPIMLNVGFQETIEIEGKEEKFPKIY